MKHPFSFAALLLAGAMSVSCSNNQAEADYRIIPLPNEITLQTAQKPFVLSASTRICCPDSSEAMQTNASLLSTYIQDLTGIVPAVQTEAAKGSITLVLDTTIANAEGYRLTVSSDGITIAGATEAGVFYGIQTLRKSIPAGATGDIAFPAAEVNDAPRFAYRGAHLDVSRHFFPADSVKRFIDILALHNINRFHWHLSDDQGWRIEIKSRPELTAVGSQRAGTVIGHNSGEYDSIPYGGYFTQDEVRDIIAYAQERHITIIPEIDMPGHMLAALTAYPELGCTGGPYAVWQQWGVSNDVLCAGNDATLKFLEDVFKEIIDLFPSEYIHVGGDECPKRRWKSCPKCQARISKLGLKTDKEHTAEERLQSYLIGYVEQFLNAHGRNIIGWDEILEGGVAPNATIMSWRGEGGGIAAARLHHDVIMTPNTYLYFDYYQTKDTKDEPIAIGGYLPLERVYSYEPMPAMLSPEEQSYIKGVQANLWTEYISTFSQVEYMELPRLAALSEVQWSTPEQKDYNDFLHRLPKLVNTYEAYGYNYAKHAFDVTAQFIPNTEQGTLDIVLSTIDDCPVYYTLDGTDPTTASALYEDTLHLTESGEFRAVAIRPTSRSHMLSEKIAFNKASMKPITMLQPINPQYAYAGAPTLVDGLKGNGNYKTGRWIAFVGNDMEAVIDLQEPTGISSAAVSTCVEKGDWIFDARNFTVAVSDDGEAFTTVASEDYPTRTLDDYNGIYDHELTFPTVTARYVKVTLTSDTLPEWHSGKGRPAFLFIDEISLD